MNHGLSRIKLAAVFVLAFQLILGAKLFAAEAPTLRGVYNALGGNM